MGGAPRKKATRKRETIWKLPSGSGYPDKIQTTLVYEEILSLYNATPKGNYTFRGNSVYDPDYTSTGHQPRTFDTYATLYGKFRVLSTKIHIEGLNTQTVAGTIFAINANTDPYSFATWQEVAELPNTKISQIIPVSSRYPFRVTFNNYTQKILGLSSPEVWDEDYSCTASANPTNLWYYNIFYCSSDFATNAQLNCRVRLEYNVVCYDRIQNIPSKKLTDTSESRLYKKEILPSPLPPD